MSLGIVWNLVKFKISIYLNLLHPDTLWFVENILFFTLVLLKKQIVKQMFSEPLLDLTQTNVLRLSSLLLSYEFWDFFICEK